MRLLAATVLLSSLALVACRTTPSAGQARTTVETLESLAASPPQSAADADRLHLQLCSDLPSCAGSCKVAFAEAAATTLEEERAQKLDQCSSDFRARAASSERLSSSAFVREQLKLSLDLTREELSDDADRARLDAARARLGV
jgi:hypothetical protein